MKLISALVLLVVSALGAHACSSSSGGSTVSPLDVARNGLAGICADEAATAAASGASAPSLPISPSQLAQLRASDPSGLAALEQAAGGSLSCPTTTTTAAGG